MKHYGSILFIPVLMLLILAIGLPLTKHPEPTYYSLQDEIQLHKQAITYELVEEVNSYIQSTAPNSSLQGLSIVNSCMSNDLDICFVLAQAQKESHFGTKGLARKTNSVWNVFAYDGKSEKEISSKGKYPTANHSIEPYINLLQKRYLVNKTEYDLLVKYVDKDGKRYASDPNYEVELTSIYKSIKENTKIDSLSTVYKYYQALL